MPEKNSNRQNKQHHRHQNPARPTKAPKVKTSWRCRICKQSQDNSLSFCLQCYQSLYYYSYINMHLFVESDNSFQDIYFPNPYLPPARRAIAAAPQCPTDQQVALDINWVENILVGQ